MSLLMILILYDLCYTITYFVYVDIGLMMGRYGFINYINTTAVITENGH